MYVYWILYLVHIGGDYTIYCSHAPRGACELKCPVCGKDFDAYYSHAPRGACELKFNFTMPLPSLCWSRPARGV